ITNGFAPGQDVLAMSPNPQNGITANYNAGTGVLTLSGVSSLANYQTALRSVTYFNTSDAPLTTTRTIAFMVNDGQSDSNIATRKITVTPVNDPPVGTATTITMLENTTYSFTSGDFGFTDPLDSPANNFLAVKITTVPAPGSLTDNGVVVTAGQFIPV